ncbi:MAG: IS1595 family transposase [Bacteroidota bacterium]|nr:IS1595 family transposase [Bacteroidota bacterium]MDP4244459.1 IS1595 family transposase [Bacteroidota bacterium]MDP4258188.1 IS1595 family transposase [Bacteroidota bacterium]
MVKDIKDLMKKFSDEAACREYLVQQRWNGEPICPYCGHRKSYRIEGGKRFKCANQTCYKKYSVTVGTIFEASNIPLTTWFPAVYIATAHKKGISSVQLGKDLGVTQKTAWFMLHRIREGLKENNPLLLEKEVQVDEAYIGGREQFKHKDKRKDTSGKGEKVPVVGMIETGGQVVTQVMPWVTRKNVTALFDTHMHRQAVLVTDSNPVYYKPGRRYDHKIINHAEGQFKVDQFHTNSIENYWSLLKRGIIGIYHQISPKHLQAYCNEFSFRFNRRKLHDGFRFALAIQQIEGRLTYKHLVYGKGEENQQGQDIEAIETGE